MKKLYYYCTCSTNPLDKKKVSDGNSPYREVAAHNGICLNCGHYAVASIEQKNSYELLNFITKDIPEWKPEYVRGGLSIGTTKSVERTRKRRERKKLQKGRC